MDIEITLTTRISIPDGSQVATSPIGAVMGFTLPDGRLVRPWVTLEIEEDGQEHDLGTAEEEALGIDTAGSDIERQIVEL